MAPKPKIISSYFNPTIREKEVSFQEQIELRNSYIKKIAKAILDSRENEPLIKNLEKKIENFDSETDYDFKEKCLNDLRSLREPLYFLQGCSQLEIEEANQIISREEK